MRTIFGILLLIGILAGAAGLYALLENDRPVVPRLAVVQQEHEERLFDIKPVNPGVLHQHKILLDPAYMKIYDDHLYVFDVGDYKIKRFTLTGDFLSEIIEGRGEGPGEVFTPTDFFVKGTRIWILDPNPRRISIFETNGTYLSSFSIPDLAIRMAPVGETIVLLTLMNPDLFLQIDSTGKEIRRFGNPLEEQVNNRLALDGNLVPVGDDHFIYVPFYAGYFFYHDANGSLVKSVEMVDGFPFPPEAGQITNSGRVMRAPEGKIKNLSINIHDNLLYIFTKSFNSKRNYFIDRYDVETGAYVGSGIVPLSFARKGVVYREKLYCVLDTTVIFYHIDQVND
ncbi:6-bladed beta-propeller [Rhodocaloribacter sp.]